MSRTPTTFFADDIIDLDYLPLPNDISWEEFTAMATALRERQDYGRWQLGWMLDKATESNKYGDGLIPKIADSIKAGVPWTKQTRWVASGFTPEEVRQFPELSWSFFRAVRSFCDEDKEEAFALLEKAVEDNLTVAAFELLIRGGDVSADPDKAKATPIKIDGEFTPMRLYPVRYEGTEYYISIPSTTDAQALQRILQRHGITPPSVETMHVGLTVQGLIQPWLDSFDQAGLTRQYATAKYAAQQEE